MTKTIKNKNRNDIEQQFSYLDLLSDNSPRYYKAYETEASIIDKQIRNPCAYNVAIVAPYGAGKSSVIETYLRKYRSKKNCNPRENRFVKVSLASFNSDQSTSNDTQTGKSQNNPSKIYDETAVERGILQQLLYSRQQSELPNSEIKRTNKTSRLKSIALAVCITILVSALILLGVELSPSSIWNSSSANIVLACISAVLFCGLLTYLLQRHIFRRVVYKELEVDLQKTETTVEAVNDLINKFVDEVLYFFECIDIDLVIFEDLDRLPTSAIFSKLRELNTLINNSNKRASKVTFLYAVKDDIFKTDEERAKFFDYILPIVPVVNPNATEAILAEKIKHIADKNANMALTSEFLKSISLYIPDMRIMNNTK